MRKMASQMTSLMIVYSTIYSGADQRKHQSSVSLAFVKMFPFDDIIMSRGITMMEITDILSLWRLSTFFHFINI